MRFSCSTKSSQLVDVRAGTRLIMMGIVMMISTGGSGSAGLKVILRKSSPNPAIVNPVETQPNARLQPAVSVGSVVRASSRAGLNILCCQAATSSLSPTACDTTAQRRAVGR